MDDIERKALIHGAVMEADERYEQGDGPYVELLLTTIKDRGLEVRPANAPGAVDALEFVLRTVDDPDHVDALEFVLRTVDDPDLSEDEILRRVSDVVSRTLDQIVRGRQAA